MELDSRTTETMNILTSVVYGSTVEDDVMDETVRQNLEKEAIDAIVKAVSMTAVSLRKMHMDIWSNLWTTGFGISHSMADNAVNERQINATMYYVLSQAPAPIHSVHTTEARKNELHSYLAYSEGCFGGLPTL